MTHWGPFQPDPFYDSMSSSSSCKELQELPEVHGKDAEAHWLVNNLCAQQVLDSEKQWGQLKGPKLSTPGDLVETSGGGLSLHKSFYVLLVTEIYSILYHRNSLSFSMLHFICCQHSKIHNVLNIRVKYVESHVPRRITTATLLTVLFIFEVLM